MNAIKCWSVLILLNSWDKSVSWTILCIQMISLKMKLIDKLIEMGGAEGDNL